MPRCGNNNWYQSLVDPRRGRGARSVRGEHGGHGGGEGTPYVRRVRRPRRTCVVAQRLRWRGVAPREEDRAPGHAGSAVLIVLERDVGTSWGVWSAATVAEEEEDRAARAAALPALVCGMGVS